MPRKAPAASDAVASKKSVVKKTTKQNHSRRRSKAVIVDVINDEDLVAPALESSFPDLPAASPSPEDDYLDGDSAGETDIDQQKKFFSNLVADIKNKSDRSDSSAAGPAHQAVARKSISLYRRLVLKFIGLVLVLAALVGYFSFSRLTITITPQGEIIKDTLLLKVGGAATTTLPGANDPRTVIEGAVQAIDYTVSQIYPATGEDFLGQEISGQVRIINRHTSNQPLVATTRLLSPDGKLFRIKTAVNVPAGGEATVSIYADKPASELAIAPTSFTIPGLWSGLQDKIYAQSDAPFVFQQKTVKYVKASDLQRVAEEAEGLLLKEAAKSRLNEEESSDYYLFSLAVPAIIEVSAKVNDQQDSFIATSTAKIVMVSFPKVEAEQLALAKLNLFIPDDKELVGFDKQSLAYSLEDFDGATGVATIKASFSGLMSLKTSAEIIDRRQLVNLTAGQIEQYLENFPGIKKYELRFSPAFIKKAPNLIDRIQIKINKI
jgi:hypothetical protein